MIDAVVLLVLVLLGGIQGALRRVFHGPRHPGWSFALDVFVSLQRASYAQLGRLGPKRFRDASDTLSPLRAGGVPFRAVDGAVPGYWVEPVDAGETVILYFHGGGYIFGSFRTHGTLIGALARSAGARVFVPSYRLAPEHPLPAAIEDGVAAFASLLEQGIPAHRIVLAGDSAGGHLVLATLLALRDSGRPMPAAAVALSPWTDLANSGETFESHAAFDFVSRQACDIAAEGALSGQPAAVYSLLDAKLHGLPPVLIHAGGAETLLVQIQAFAASAERQGAAVELVVYPGMVHVWHMLVGVTPVATEALGAVGDFVRRSTSS